MSKIQRKCATRYCRKTAVPGRTLCHRCIKRKYARAHPIRYSYNTLKQNAKRRCVHFDLTFEQYEAFCLSTGYHLKKGRKPDSASIDRIDNNLGYTLENIRVLSLSHNSAKANHNEYPF